MSKKVFVEIKNAPATLEYPWFAKKAKSPEKGDKCHPKGIEPVQSKFSRKCRVKTFKKCQRNRVLKVTQRPSLP
ncbi:MAG TPA: hypothetical protein DCG87_02935 [Synergistaceae bacterium]|nr:hypothetical protein [Synergistaceae bacterium]